MLQASHIEQETDEQAVKYYVDRYPEVQLVICAKCKRELCLWYLDPQMAPRFLSNHHRGMQRVTLSGALRSTRKRLDGHMGYKCACGNDSILAEVEEGIVPQLKINQLGQVMNPEQSLDIYPHHEAAVKLVLAKYGDKAKVKDFKGGDHVVDGFIHRRLK